MTAPPTPSADDMLQTPMETMELNQPLAPPAVLPSPASAPSLDDFVVGEELGQGAYGAVYSCTHRSSGVAYALKSISIEHATRHGGLEQVANEREALLALNSPGHPNVVRLHAALRDAECLYLVLELATGGELFSHIRRMGACALPCARWLAAELVNALGEVLTST